MVDCAIAKEQFFNVFRLEYGKAMAGRIDVGARIVTGQAGPSYRKVIVGAKGIGHEKRMQGNNV